MRRAKKSLYKEIHQPIKICSLISWDKTKVGQAQGGHLRVGTSLNLSTDKVLWQNRSVF